MFASGYSAVRRMAAGAALLLSVVLVSSAGAGEMEDRDDISRQVILALTGNDYSKLEAMASGFRAGNKRTASGLWKLTLYDYAVAALFEISSPDSDQWEYVDNFVRGWVAANPKSVNAHIAYAHFLSKRGWSYRGTGFASTVKAENWKPFYENQERARKYLIDHAELIGNDPRYDDLMLEILNDLQVPDAEFDKFLNDSLNRHPDYYQIYFTAMNHYLPKWGGDTVAVEAFARNAAIRTRDHEGNGLYARIYWAASQFQFVDALFAASDANWPVMKRGIEDVLRDYPDQWNINNFARFACLAGDRDLAKSLVERVEEPAIPQAWSGQIRFDDCRAWATSD